MATASRRATTSGVREAAASVVLVAAVVGAIRMDSGRARSHAAMVSREPARAAANAAARATIGVSVRPVHRAARVERPQVLASGRRYEASSVGRLIATAASNIAR